MPLGHTHDTGVRNSAGYTLNYNEFVVYDTCQVNFVVVVVVFVFVIVVVVVVVVFVIVIFILQIKMKYLVRLKFNFK